MQLKQTDKDNNLNNKKGPTKCISFQYVAYSFDIP